MLFRVFFSFIKVITYLREINFHSFIHSFIHSAGGPLSIHRFSWIHIIRFALKTFNLYILIRRGQLKNAAFILSLNEFIPSFKTLGGILPFLMFNLLANYYNPILLLLFLRIINVVCLEDNICLSFKAIHSIE